MQLGKVRLDFCRTFARFFFLTYMKNVSRFSKQKNIWCLEMLWRTILYLQLVSIVQLLLLYKRHIITGTNYSLRLYALYDCVVYIFVFAIVGILSAPMLASGGLANVATKSRTARRVHRPRSRSSRAPSRLNISHRSPSVNVFTKWTIIEMIHLASCYVETLHLHCIICLCRTHIHIQYTHSRHTHTPSNTLQTSFYFNCITALDCTQSRLSASSASRKNLWETVVCMTSQKKQKRERTISRRFFLSFQNSCFYLK